MKQTEGEIYREPERDLPVYGSCDVLIVGGGPAGTTAAVAAAREGADVVLLERYGCLGGLSTGGLVFWIDRMTDWKGKLVVAGLGGELMDRIGADETLGPPKELWGSTEPTPVAYWSQRTSAFRGMVHWSPTVDPEVLKLVSNDIVREAGVHVMFHSWVVAAINDGNQVKGVVFESKEGRKALMAKVVIDCSGDGDVFAQAGAEFDADSDPESAHARITTSFRFGNVDMRRYLDFRMLQQDKHRDLMSKAAEEGVNLQAHATPYDSTALFMSPKMSGYNPLSVADLTAVEFKSRDVMRKGLVYFRAHVPGFERAWILDTAAQIGTRHARRLTGVERVTIQHWRRDGTFADSVGLCPGLTPEFPTLEIPYTCMVPREVEGLLAAGRNLSADTQSHGPLREVPECWVMGQGAGIAAAMAVRGNIAVRDIAIAELQQKLEKQGVMVFRAPGEEPTAPANEDAFKGSIHHTAAGMTSR